MAWTPCGLRVPWQLRILGAIASRLEAIPIRLEAVIEAIAFRLEAVASRLETVTCLRLRHKGAGLSLTRQFGHLASPVLSLYGPCIMAPPCFQVPILNSQWSRSRGWCH